VKQFFGDEAATVHEMGWDAFEDGPLLKVAQGQFDCLLTIDRGIEHQQNVARLTIGIVVVHVAKNQLVHYQALQRQLVEAVNSVGPGVVVHVGGSSKA
jgi:hypothetical protein